MYEMLRLVQLLKTEEATLISERGLYLCRQLPTLPHTFACSTSAWRVLVQHYCAVPPMTVPLSVSTSNSSVPPFTKTVLKWSADDPLGVICSVPVQSDASV
jgi:hypothetical protein